MQLSQPQAFQAGLKISKFRNPVSISLFGLVVTAFNLNTEGVPAPHLNQPPPDKCSINGTNKLKFCV